ncbi:hypothetical protein CDL12_07264 [Handroanthus impetiginosus]|uniref:Uncharacterized protein n=1 Tax=Handroanthus impetiginosus TaxID=429701 RepID=A0A2G9HR86_9LAMI|nr:hypothetical protein CDL12_07264 [Handroanthus impetiginosus]
MSLQICDFGRIQFLRDGNNFALPNAHFRFSKRNPKASSLSFRCVSGLACNSISVSDIAGVFHNKVMVAAALSAAIGQLLKPFTSTLFYGKKFDLKAAIQAGGFPSTHSSGVRREVGTHAKELNKVLLRTTSYSTSSRKDANDLTNSFTRESSSDLENIDPCFSEEQSSFEMEPTNSPLLVKPDDRKQSRTSSRRSSDVNGGLEGMPYSCSPLKESIGHTEIEVVAGALLGFLVSLVICRYV